VIQSFADATTKDIYDGVDSKAARRIPKAIWPVVRRKLDALNAATSTQDLAQVPGNQLKPLAGKRRGQFSMRVNQQYRITFRFESGHAFNVCWCEDYH
jgi:proteic killer suppression protein